MTTQPYNGPTQSAEEFLATPYDESEDEEQSTDTLFGPPEFVSDYQLPESDRGGWVPSDQLWVIPDAHPLAGVLGRIADALESKGAVSPETYQALSEAYDDTEAKNRDLYELVEQIEGIVKGSKSQVSLAVKQAITYWRNPAAPVVDQAPAIVAAAELNDSNAPAHNHEWSESVPRTCTVEGCVAWIDTSDPEHPQGVVRGPEDPDFPAEPTDG